MAANNDHVQRKTGVGLLIIDVINDFDFPEAEQLLQYCGPMAEAICRLRQRAKTAGIPVIYVNDNFGRWRSSFDSQIERCLHRPRAKMIRQLKPDSEDFFVLKPMHSGFYCTSLEVLLQHLKIEKLVLTGIAADLCVLFTANDAYMRGYQVLVPSDCTASNNADEARRAINHMEKALKADVSNSTELNLTDLSIVT